MFDSLFTDTEDRDADDELIVDVSCPDATVADKRRFIVWILKGERVIFRIE